MCQTLDNIGDVDHRSTERESKDAVLVTRSLGGVSPVLNWTNIL